MTDEILTISVPEAGRRYFGLSRNGSYAAAVRGEIASSDQVANASITHLVRKSEASDMTTLLTMQPWHRPLLGPHSHLSRCEGPSFKGRWRIERYRRVV